MKKIFVRLVVFCFPLLLLLYGWPVNKRDLYADLTENCSNQAIWIYDRIHSNPTPVDIVFIGTSHTMNGIEDAQIDSILAGRNVHTMNMGYCQFGIDLHYIFLKELLQNKKPKEVIFEVGDNEDRYSHPVFPYLADNKDVLTASILFNPDYFSDNYRHLYYKLEIIHKRFFGEIPDVQINKDNYGAKSFPDTVSVDMLNKAKARWSKAEMDKTKGFESWFYMKYPKSYYEKMGALCKQYHVKMTFLYLPTYGEPYQPPAAYDFYKSYGEVLMPPDSIFKNTNYWVEENHLNKAGARALSAWCAGVIGKR